MRNERGQSMIEVIVATGIIMSAVASALTLVASAVRAEKNSEARIVAGNLGREGIEVARAIRDSNWLADRPFDDGLVGPSDDSSGVPVFDPDANDWSVDFTPSSLNDDAARVYRYGTGAGNAVPGLMVQALTPPAGAALTQFSRLLTITALCDDGAGGYAQASVGTDCGAAQKVGVDVAVSMRWTVGDAVRTLTMEERLLDWR